MFIVKFTELTEKVSPSAAIFPEYLVLWSWKGKVQMLQLEFLQTSWLNMALIKTSE